MRTKKEIREQVIANYLPSEEKLFMMQASMWVPMVRGIGFCETFRDAQITGYLRILRSHCETEEDLDELREYVTPILKKLGYMEKTNENLVKLNKSLMNLENMEKTNENLGN
jgi:hypothetical protein